MEDQQLQGEFSAFERKYAEAALQNTYNQLELRIKQCTAKLTKIDRQLRNEIVERRRAEEEVQLLQKITPAISESQNFHASRRWLCNKFVNSLVGLLAKCGFLALTAQYFSLPLLGIALMKVVSRAFAFSATSFNFQQVLIYQGAFGHQGNPSGFLSLRTNTSPSFLRAHLAYDAGFKAALGIPIIAHTSPDSDPEVLAVLASFMSKTCEEDKRLVEIVSTVAIQLGSLVQRKRAESALRESKARYGTLVKQTSEEIFRLRLKLKVFWKRMKHLLIYSVTLANN